MLEIGKLLAHEGFRKCGVSSWKVHKELESVSSKRGLDGID